MARFYLYVNRIPRADSSTTSYDFELCDEQCFRTLCRSSQGLRSLVDSAELNCDGRDAIPIYDHAPGDIAGFFKTALLSREQKTEVEQYLSESGRKVRWITIAEEIQELKKRLKELHSFLLRIQA